MEPGAGAGAGAGTSRKSRPLTLTQLMPNLNGIATENAKHIFSVKKPPKKLQTTIVPPTIEKIHVFTLKELNASRLIDAIKGRSPATHGKLPLSNKKPRWISSVKRDNKRPAPMTSSMKNKYNAAESKYAAARKLNFQANVKIVPSNIPRPSIHKFASPKRLTKYDKKTSNSVMKIFNGKNSARISGICKFSETPKSKGKTMKSEQINIENKENINRKSNIRETFLQPTKVTNLDESYSQLCIKKEKRPLTPSPSNSQNSDISFLQREKELCDDKEGQVITNESPINSTPFKKYRNVNDSFSESSDFDSFVKCSDNTMTKERSCDTDKSAEESDIMSLCNLMDKAKFGQIENKNKSGGELLKMKTETLQEIDRLKKQRSMIDESLQYNENMLKIINNLIEQNTERRKSKQLKCKVQPKTPSNIEVTVNFDIKAGSRTCKPALLGSSKSPTYKIPKRTPCLRKTIISKSMPKNLNNIELETPSRKPVRNEALNMYMKMKEQCNFLMTPVARKGPVNRINETCNTPALTSLNLQSQLDKLYNGTP